MTSQVERFLSVQLKALIALLSLYSSFFLSIVQYKTFRGFLCFQISRSIFELEKCFLFKQVRVLPVTDWLCY